MESYKVQWIPFVKVENSITLSELLACRVCLATDSKLFDLHKNKLTLMFGDLTGTQVSKSDGLPQHICHVCYVMLVKSSAFRAKCRRVHVLLQDARVKQPLMTTEYIRTLDRSQLKLHFTFTNALTLDFPPTDEPIIPEPVILTNEENPLVKAEPLIEFDDDITKDWNEPKENYEFIETKSQLREALDKENENDTFIEIYSTHNKEKVTEEKIKKKRPLRKKEPAKPKVQKVKKVREKKRKRPFNMKFIEDFAGFAETYNCKVLFLTREQQLKEVEERKESEYFKKSRFKCTICYKGFMNVSAHKNHMATHDKASGDNVCDVCLARFNIREHLLNHQRRCHKYNFICKICEHVSKVVTNAKNHFKKHEGVKYECKPCDKQFNTMSTYMSHKRQYHHSVTCDVCKETVTGGSKGLEEHHQQRHLTVKFPCEACRNQFESQEAYNRHLSQDGFCNVDFPCIKCGENFTSKPALHDHRESVHNDTLFRCEECPAALPTGRKLAAHWLSKHSEISYMCEICAKRYKSKLMLRRHQCTHTGETGEKPFACTICPKRFSLKFFLKEHMNTHTGERPYKCAHCDGTFRSYAARYNHIILAHRKKRPYSCHLCDKSYVFASDLKTHVRIHMKIPRPTRNPPNRRTRNKNNKTPNTNTFNTYMPFHFNCHDQTQNMQEAMVQSPSWRQQQSQRNRDWTACEPQLLF